MKCGRCEYIDSVATSGEREYYCTALPGCPIVCFDLSCRNDAVRRRALRRDMLLHEEIAADLRQRLEDDGGADDQT